MRGRSARRSRHDENGEVPNTKRCSELGMSFVHNPDGTLRRTERQRAPDYAATKALVIEDEMIQPSKSAFRGADVALYARAQRT